MGENMSKRLKLVSTTEAEMEERSFPNQYPDWEQGLAVSNAGAELDSDEPQLCCFVFKITQNSVKRPPHRTLFIYVCIFILIAVD
uniref:Uncharacterized protein n=1 Tax=Poecilia mexicana TaxID=48701 RepID=A0A3B3WZG2_9TELE